MIIFRGLTAAGIFAGVGMGLAGPASAVAPPPDGTYSYTQAGVSSVTWTITALCNQVSGTRDLDHFSDPVIQTEQCALNVVSETPSKVSRAEKLQNYGGRARLVSDRWTFEVPQADGVSCPGGGTAPSTEIYSFDDATLTGTHTSIHDAVCGMQPAISKQPFTLRLLGPPPTPVERYPLYCNPIAECY